ncbi:hypothetical protein, partial [Mammaliicoccus sciuri]
MQPILRVFNTLKHIHTNTSTHLSATKIKMTLFLYVSSKETAENDINNDWLYTLKKHDKIIAVASVGDFDELRDLHWKPK